MKLTVDLNNESDVAVALDMLLSLTGETPDVVVPKEPPVVAVPEETPVAAVPEEDPKIGVQLDSNGTPWIKGVHATTKGVNKDGTWKKLRGADPDEVRRAEEEARDRLAKTPEPTIPEEPAAPEEPVFEPPQGAHPITEPAQEKPVPTLADLAASFEEAQNLGLVTYDGAEAMYKDAGCEQVTDIATNDAARTIVVEKLRAMIEAHNQPALPGIPGIPGAAA